MKVSEMVELLLRIPQESEVYLCNAHLQVMTIAAAQYDSRYYSIRFKCEPKMELPARLPEPCFLYFNEQPHCVAVGPIAIGDNVETTGRNADVDLMVKKEELC